MLVQLILVHLQARHSRAVPGFRLPGTPSVPAGGSRSAQHRSRNSLIIEHERLEDPCTGSVLVRRSGRSPSQRHFPAPRVRSRRRSWWWRYRCGDHKACGAAIRAVTVTVRVAGLQLSERLALRQSAPSFALTTSLTPKRRDQRAKILTPRRQVLLTVDPRPACLQRRSARRDAQPQVLREDNQVDGFVKGELHDGVVQQWSEEEGWGVVDSAATPGGCWTHFSAVVSAGYRCFYGCQAAIEAG
jgi:hypothetical protein